MRWGSVRHRPERVLFGILSVTVAAVIVSMLFLRVGPGWTGKEEARLPSGPPPMDRAAHGKTETAVFAMGCFWSPDSRFGIIPGVLRTRVGYSGATEFNPSYGGRGDHIESVEVQFDPAVVSYDALLDVFWRGHDPAAIMWKRQYISAIFPQSEEQRAEAFRSRDREGARRKGRIRTEILSNYRFFPAPAYHQKFALRGKTALLKEFQAMYPDYRDFMASTAVTRVNGYAGGFGTCESLHKEIDGFGLSPAGRRRLEEVVCTRNDRKPAAPPCPIGRTT